MSRFNIQNFQAEVDHKNGVMRTNKFLVRFAPPFIMAGRPGISQVSSEFSGAHFWCQDVTLPGYQIMTSTYRRHTYGTNESRPYGPNFQQVQLTFMMDNDAFIWDYFNAWLQSILPHDSQTNGINSPSTYSNASRVYELSYKHEYATDLEILIFNESGQNTLKVTLREAFPSNMNGIPFSWGAQNAYAQFTVFIDYLDWFSQTASNDLFRASGTAGAFAPGLNEF